MEIRNVDGEIIEPNFKFNLNCIDYCDANPINPIDGIDDRRLLELSNSLPPESMNDFFMFMSGTMVNRGDWTLVEYLMFHTRQINLN